MDSFTPTTKTQQALSAAVQAAAAAGNPDVRPAHILVALLDHPTESPYGNPIPGLEELGGVQGKTFRDGVESLVDVVRDGHESDVEVGTAGRVITATSGKVVGYAVTAATNNSDAEITLL